MAKEVVAQGTEHNTLAFGTKAIGEIQAENNFRIDGTVDGTIVCKGKVIIGNKGIIEGTLTCVSAEVMGSVKGKIFVSDTLSLKSTSKVEGEIKAKILSIEPNAIFIGTCDMAEDKKQSEKPQQPAGK